MEDIKNKIYWVSKLITPTEWKSHYSQSLPYCYLGKEEKKIKVGFCVFGKIPSDCMELTDKELLQVDDYRRNCKVYPLPFEKKSELN